MIKNILYTSSDSSPQSGAFLQLLYMTKGISNYGYNSILALHKEGQELFFWSESNKQKVFFFDLPRLKRHQNAVYYLKYLLQNIICIVGLVRLIKRKNIKIVHINEIYDIYAGIASFIAGVPCVWHIRAEPLQWIKWFLSRIVLVFAKKVIVVSKSVQNQVFKKVNGRKVNILYDPGPDLIKFNPEIDGSLVRKEFGIFKDDFLITQVSKLVEQKGHENLIRAAPIVLKSFPNNRFMIVGGQLEGKHHEKYANYIKALPSKLGIKEKVIFTGYREDIQRIISASDIIVHCPMYPDPFPGVVLQGMAVGKPVIASNLGGACEQIEDGISGILIEPSNHNSLASAICSLLKNNEKRQNLGKIAAELVASKYTPDRFFKNLSKIYNEIIRL